jgi:hypothetical protein
MPKQQEKQIFFDLILHLISTISERYKRLSLNTNQAASNVIFGKNSSTDSAGEPRDFDVVIMEHKIIQQTNAKKLTNKLEEIELEELDFLAKNVDEVAKILLLFLDFKNFSLACRLVNEKYMGNFSVMKIVFSWILVNLVKRKDEHFKDWERIEKFSYKWSRVVDPTKFKIHASKLYDNLAKEDIRENIVRENIVREKNCGEKIIGENEYLRNVFIVYWMAHIKKRTRKYHEGKFSENTRNMNRKALEQENKKMIQLVAVCQKYQMSKIYKRIFAKKKNYENFIKFLNNNFIKEMAEFQYELIKTYLETIRKKVLEDQIFCIEDFMQKRKNMIPIWTPKQIQDAQKFTKKFTENLFEENIQIKPKDFFLGKRDLLEFGKGENLKNEEIMNSTKKVKSVGFFITKKPFESIKTKPSANLRALVDFDFLLKIEKNLKKGNKKDEDDVQAKMDIELGKVGKGAKSEKGGSLKKRDDGVFKGFRSPKVVGGGFGKKRGRKKGGKEEWKKRVEGMLCSKNSRRAN